MRLSEAFTMIKDKFPDAHEVSHPEKINQGGLYLYFDGITPRNTCNDSAHFVLLLAGTTLSVKGDSSIVKRLEEIRKSVLQLGVPNQANYFRGIKAAVFEGDKLFMYAIKLEIEVTI